MKLRTIGVVAALALAAGSAQAQEAGWDTKYGILFTLPNPFGGASGTNVIDDYSGTVGAQYNLGPQTALRLSADLSRVSEGPTKTTVGGVDFEDVPLWTSQYDLVLAGEYMIRTTTAAVAPYLGAGAFIGYSQASQKGDDKIDGTTVAEYDYTERSYALGCIAKLGLEWRVHKTIALFAEYQATLKLIEGTSAKDDIADASSSEKHFINLDTGLAQGGQLGVIAFF